MLTSAGLLKTIGGAEVQLTIDDVVATTVINGRTYRASQFRKTADGVKVAFVEYYHPDRGWREVQPWHRIKEVASILWT